MITEQFEGDLASIQELIGFAHNPDLAAFEGGDVVQIWQDGSITFQKRGRLLWMRSIHRDVGGVEGLSLWMPCERGVHGFAFVTKEDAYEIGRQIANFLSRYPQLKITSGEVSRYASWVNREKARAA